VSISGDVAMTQLVDKPVVGVHVKMPKRIFRDKAAATQKR
jgi:acetamidase/formamidase